MSRHLLGEGEATQPDHRGARLRRQTQVREFNHLHESPSNGRALYV